MNQQERDAQETKDQSEILGLAKNKNFRVRSLVAFNPKTPTNVLEELLEDENQNVKQAAKDNLAKRGVTIKA